MNTRLKNLRKTLGLSQDAFAEKIGMKGSSISLLESGARNMTTQVIKSICREFNVDFIWLTTGKGDMFLEEDEDVELIHYLEDVLNTYPHLKDALIRFSKVAKMQDLERLDEIVSEILDKKPEQ